MNEHSSHIVGMGACNSIANTVADFDAGLRAGRSGVRKISSNRLGCKLSDYNFQRAVETITKDNPELGKQAQSLGRRTSISLQSTISSALEAWLDAGLDRIPVAADRIALIVAGQYSIGNTFAAAVTKHQDAPEFVSPRFALETQETHIIGLISELLNIQGDGFCVGGASASGNIAVIRAEQLLRLGIADVCVVCATSADLSDLELQAFENVGALGGRQFHNAPERAYRPFDKDRDGFIYGQGSACVVLERETSMIKRGRSPRATILGTSSKLSAHAGAAPSLDTEIQVMRNAIAMANLTPQDVSYVNAHGTGSALGDETEALAVTEVFKPSLVRVNSTKSLIGHCLAAAGLQELIATVLQLNGNYRHESANICNPITDEIELVRELTPDDGRYALTNSFGFSGLHSSILIKGSR